MDLFTDASLNDSKKIAGIGCVCVDKEKGEIQQKSSYFNAKSIHVAELCALAYAVQNAAEMQIKEVRIVSDSRSALNTLHCYMNCLKAKRLSTEQKKFLQNLENSPTEKIALECMKSIFSTSGISFTFEHVPGHQKRVKEGSDGYWNLQADEVAGSGRLLGERHLNDGNILLAEDLLKTTSLSSVYPEWLKKVNTIYVFPNRKKKEPKKVSHHKENCGKRAGSFNARIAFRTRN